MKRKTIRFLNLKEAGSTWENAASGVTTLSLCEALCHILSHVRESIPRRWSESGSLARRGTWTAFQG
ncbi:hypothetical protein R1flu_005624 [Riccia fluitans]|uniref:Uncharacterized protein n=1 Tax=Riccia fluitans TaxID=41844 RepID=A0ABD1YTN9_9MARC